MIKAVIFDMFETLVTLFVGRTYFSENIAQDLGIPLDSFRKAWHSNEHERTIGKYTMKEFQNQAALRLIIGTRRAKFNRVRPAECKK